MKSASRPHLIDAERLQDGVIITFDDGKSAVFSASLLYKTLPKAYEIVPIPED